MMLLHLTVVIIQLIICYGGRDYVVRYIDSTPRRCLPIYNCKPGHEILPCTTEFLEEICRPCYDDPNTYEKDYVQPDYISSVDDLNKLRCFKPLIINGRSAVCTGQDLSYDRVDLGDKITCLAGRGCKCDVNKCHFGDPCYCDNYRHKKSEGCPPGKHLNNSGVCVPCPDGFVKNESGCGPCWRVPTNTTVTTTTKKSVPSVPTVQPPTTTEATTPKPKPTTQKTTTTQKVIVTPKPRDEEEDNSTTPIIIGIIAAVVFLIIILIIIIVLYRKGKCRTIKIMLDRDRRNGPEERNNPGDEEQQPLQLENLQNEINDIHIIERQNSAGNKPNNNNMTRIESECPSERFDSASTVSVNRQLSNISATDRINSTKSECSPLLKVDDKMDFNPHMINRINSVPNPTILHREDSLPNPQELNRTVSVPQQPSQNEYTAMPSYNNNSSSQLVPSPTSGRQPFLDTMGGGIPPLDFDNIQSSNPVMNTELPNIGEFKRSISKDSTSSIELSSSSPLNSVREETGKEIQDEVAEEFNRSGVVPECDISNNADYSDCHLSQFPDTPRDSDITNQIDSRLEQYNHTVTGTDDGATCSVQRLPSEHEEETMKKKDLESNLDSGLVSNLSKGSDLSKSDSV